MKDAFKLILIHEMPVRYFVRPQACYLNYLLYSCMSLYETIAYILTLHGQLTEQLFAEPFACNELYWRGRRWQALWCSQVSFMHCLQWKCHFYVTMIMYFDMALILFSIKLTLYFAGNGESALWNCMHSILVGITQKSLIVHWSLVMCLLIFLLTPCLTSSKPLLHTMITQIARWSSILVLWRYR